MKSAIKKIPKIVEYAKKNEFNKIINVFDGLDSVKLTEKENTALIIAKEKVFNVLRFELKRSIVSGKILEKMKIDILLKMSQENIEEAKQLIRNATLRRFVLDFQSKNMALKSLDKIQNIFSSLILLFDKVKFFYGRLPQEWNLEGEFLFYSVLHIKEILFEAYIGKWTKEEYLVAIRSIIDFERKYTKNFFKKDCCKNKEECNNSPSLLERSSLENDMGFDKKTQTGSEDNTLTQIIKYEGKCSHISKNMILFDKDQVLTGKKNMKTNFIVLYHKNNKSLSDFCKHRKMLSYLLLPDINIYIESLFSPVYKIKLCQKTTEMNLIKSFVTFFSEVGSVLVQIQHFQEPNVYEVFLGLFDSILIKMLEIIHIPAKYRDLLVLLNTLSFIEHTTSDLLEKTGRYTVFKNASKDKTRILEKKTCVSIERILKMIFRRNVKERILFSSDFIDILTREVFSLNQIDFDDSVFNFLIETLLSYQFNRIVNLRMNSDQAEVLIMEIVEIKTFIRQNMQKIPFIDLIENYLKIFICSIENPKTFVTCFNHLNQDLFNFQNIIDALEDRSKNEQLLIEYNNQRNKMIKYQRNDES